MSERAQDAAATADADVAAPVNVSGRRADWRFSELMPAAMTAAFRCRMIYRRRLTPSMLISRVLSATGFYRRLGSSEPEPPDFGAASRAQHCRPRRGVDASAIWRAVSLIIYVTRAFCRPMRSLARP